MPTTTSKQAATAVTISRWCLIHALTCIAGVMLALTSLQPAWLALTCAASFTLLLVVTRGQWTPTAAFGPANWITMGRLLLAGSLLFLPGSTAAGFATVGLSIAILVLDGFDGWIARKKSLSSEFGEYFDKESDAFFMLVLCMAAYLQGRLDVWILIPGLLRYVFVLALFAARPDQGKEYRSTWARWIYVIAISCLLSVFVLPAWIHIPAVTVATIALVLSFAHYFRWLLTQWLSRRVSSSHWLWGVAAFVTLNSLLLLPSLLTNLETSTFFPIPDPSKPTTTLTWTRGWYDYILYFFVRRPNQDLFRICTDLVLLLGIYAVFRHKKNTLYWVAAIFMAFLAYELYDAVAYSFFHRHGILYEDAQYGVNMYYLLLDSLSPRHAFRIIAAATGTVLLAWILPLLFRKALALFSAPPLRAPAAWLGGSIAIATLFVWFWFGFNDERPTLRSVTGKIVANAADSRQLAATLAAVSSLPVDSVYYSYDDRAFVGRPNIVLFMVESYGRILKDAPYLAPRYDSLMQALEREFAEAGFSSATRTSVAPVSGGLSWLSMNSVMAGLNMANKTFFTRYQSRIDTYPHLIGRLQHSGYHTITLQPPNRARVGLPLDNHYRFDTTIFFDDLNYEGPAYSIWIIPDQYSLEYAQEHVLRHTPSPFFLFFETATTHAPWTDLPPYLENWRDLNEKKSPAPVENNSLAKQLRTSFQNRFYENTPYAAVQYWESMHYDLAVLRDYVVRHAPPNTLILIVGDHQPPLLPSTSYETPIHVIARDSTLIDRFTPFGFHPGMEMPAAPGDTLMHAGIYSMLIDILTDTTGVLPTPAYRPQGIAPSILTGSGVLSPGS